VQAGVDHRDPAQEDRLQLRGWGDFAGTPDINRHAREFSRHLLSREFVGGCATRVFSHKAEFILYP